MSAAKTPGTQPNSVNKNTMIIDPHPLSTTASGGHTMDNNTLKHPINKLQIYVN